MFQVNSFLRSATCRAVRNFSSLQSAKTSGRELLRQNVSLNSKRCMSGHGPDISKLQATIYIAISGGVFVAIGMYQAKSMRNRIEAFETGQTIPFKTMTDEEYLLYKEKFKKIHAEEEEEDEEELETVEEDVAESVEETTSEEIVPETEETADVEESQTQEVESQTQEEQASKDTIIFVEPPKE